MKNKKFQYVISSLKYNLFNVHPSLKAGFLLIEIMAALGAFAGLSVLVARYQVSLVRWSKEAHNYLEAVNSASDALDSWLYSAQYPEQAKNAFTVQRTVHDFIIPRQCAAQGLTAERLKKVKRVQVNVSWVAMDGHKKSITLESAGSMGSGKAEAA